jgi:hypothetical protein
MSEVTITPGKKREYTLTDGALSIFSYELMQRIPNTPIQTCALLQLLLEHKEEIEAAAQEQEHQEAQPKQPKTYEERINDLFS